MNSPSRAVVKRLREYSEYRYVSHHTKCITRPWQAPSPLVERVRGWGKYEYTQKTIHLGMYETKEQAAKAVADHQGIEVEELLK